MTDPNKVVKGNFHLALLRSLIYDLRELQQKPSKQTNKNSSTGIYSVRSNHFFKVFQLVVCSFQSLFLVSFLLKKQFCFTNAKKWISLLIEHFYINNTYYCSREDIIFFEKHKIQGGVTVIFSGEYFHVNCVVSSYNKWNIHTG